MGWGVVLGEIIAQVFGSGFPENVKVFLDNAITYPVISHVNSTRALSANCVVHYAIGSGVVGCDRSGGLWESHFGKRSADDFAFFGVDEEGTDFGFRGRGGNVLEDSGGVEDCTIGYLGFIWLIPEEKMSTCSAANSVSQLMESLVFAHFCACESR